MQYHRRMRLDLAPSTSNLIAEEMSEGRFADAEEAVAAGMLVLRYARTHRESFLDSLDEDGKQALEAMVAKGLDSLERGRHVPGERAFARAPELVESKRGGSQPT